MNGDINKPGQKKNKGTIRADIGCSAKYKKRRNHYRNRNAIRKQ